MSDITCKELNEGLLIRWYYAGLDEEIGKRIEEHVASCAACAEELEALTKEEGLIRAAMKLDVEKPTPVAVAPKKTAQWRRLMIPVFRPAPIASAVLGIILFIVFRSAPDGIIADGTPVVSVDSATVRPGETVLIPVRVSNLVGLSGLEARIRVDSSPVSISKTEKTYSVCGVKGDEIVIAALSADGWKTEGEIAFYLPVVVRAGVPRNTKIPLTFLSVRVADAQRKHPEARTQGGEISVI